MKAWNRKNKRKHTTKVKFKVEKLIYKKGIGLIYLDSKASSIVVNFKNSRTTIKIERYNGINVSGN